MENQEHVISQQYKRISKSNFMHITAKDGRQGCFVKVPGRMAESILLAFPEGNFELFVLKEAQESYTLTDAVTGGKLLTKSSLWEAIQQATLAVLELGFEGFIERQQGMIASHGLSPSFTVIEIEKKEG